MPYPARVFGPCVGAQRGFGKQLSCAKTSVESCRNLIKSILVIQPTED